MCVYMCVYIYACVFVILHVPMYACMYEYTCIAMYIYAYVCCMSHVHIFLQDHLSIDHRYPFGLPGVNVCSLDCLYSCVFLTK